jgi:FkbM family methyltransferase
MTANPDNPDNQRFRHYSSSDRVVGLIQQGCFDNLTYTCRRGLIKGMKRRGGFGWLPEVFFKSTHTPEEAFWMNLDLAKLTIYDIGAYCGVLTLFFSQHARRVVSYEPNSRNRARLRENLLLNGVTNVTVREVGVSACRGLVRMLASRHMMAGASIEQNIVAGLKESGGGLVSEMVSVIPLDDDIREMALPNPDFIKIDVEGVELQALEGARNTLRAYQPDLFIELHGETMSLKRENAAAIVAFLNDRGYQNLYQVESGVAITAQNSFLAAQGHLYCTPLGRERAGRRPGLRNGWHS